MSLSRISYGSSLTFAFFSHAFCTHIDFIHTFFLCVISPPIISIAGKMKFLDTQKIHPSVGVKKWCEMDIRRKRNEQHIFSRIHRYIKFTFGCILYLMLKRDLPLMLDYTWSIYFFSSRSYTSNFCEFLRALPWAVLEVLSLLK